MAISGLGVALATAGGVLVYAGIQNMNPLAALKEIGTGKVRPVISSGSAGLGVGEVAGGLIGQAMGAILGLPQLATAVRQFAGDHYSQAHRWDNGYSDCSSFVGKGFKALGIKPPGGSTTPEYLAWKELTKISEADLAPGDLVVNMAHMIVATSNTTGIGQQNARRNVQEGSIKDLMYGTGGYVCLRYVGPTGSPSAPKSSNSTASSGSSHPSAAAMAV